MSSSLLNLPADVWAAVTAYLHVRDIVALEMTSISLRDTVAGRNLHLQTGVRHLQGFGTGAGLQLEDADWLAVWPQLSNFREEHRKAVVMKHICGLLKRRNEAQSLIWRPLHASSTATHSRLENILTKYNHDYFDHLYTTPFNWSSAHGSYQSQHIVLQLVHPLCIIRKACIRIPQHLLHNGMYGLSVRFSVSLTKRALSPSSFWEEGKEEEYARAAASAESFWKWTSDCYAVEDARQDFLLPDALCTDGLLKVEFFPEPFCRSLPAWHATVIAMRVHGAVVRNVQLTHEGHFQPLLRDPLALRNGLATYSHKEFSGRDIPAMGSSDDNDSDNFSDEGAIFDL